MKSKSGPSRIMVTGCNGFVGKHLIRSLRQKGQIVAGIDKGKDSQHSGIAYYCADIFDKTRIKVVINDFQPTHVVHLAAITFVPDSFRHIDRTFEVNLQGTLNILSAINDLREKNTFSRLMFISTAEVYKLHTEKILLDENDALYPRNPYAISKLAAEYLCEYYYNKFNLPVIIVRPFNHTGPGQSEQFVCSDFACQIVRIEKKMQEPVIRVGNLQHQKDFLDVRDIVKAYCDLLLKDMAEDFSLYNLCSGKEVSIQWILNTLFSYSNAEINIDVAREKYRPGKSCMLGNYAKLSRDIGWSPVIPMEKTLLDLLNWWRENI